MSTFEFDCTYSAVTGEHVGGIYVPTVEHSDAHDILIDGGPTRARSNGDMDVNSGWDALTGYTQQHGYRGAVMHPSETMGDDAIREAVREAGGDVFAIVEVSPDGLSYECDSETCDADHSPIGWAVIYRAAL